MSPPSRFLVWIYAQLLKLYPTSHHGEFADEMQFVFADALEEAGTHGLGSVLRFCGRELRDLPRALIHEHLREEGKKQMRMKILYLLALLALTIACWLAAVFILGFQGLSFLIILVPLTLLCVPVVAPAARRLSARVRISAGLVILVALLVVPSSALIDLHENLPVRLPQPIEGVLTTTIFFMLPAAVIVAALLLYSSLTLWQEWRNARQGEEENSQAQRRQAGRTAAVALVLSVLLLAQTLYNLYWLMVWDSTYDPLDFLWLIFPILAALFAGLGLASTLPRWTNLAGLLYALFLPAFMIAVSIQAKNVDFRHLTQARAGQVTQAIETYYAREGRYPQDLHQLTPWYMLSLPGPVIIYGQDWCYDAGPGYYRLGFADREHWSSPNFTGHIYKTQGAVSQLQPICSKQIATLQKRFPYIY